MLEYFSMKVMSKRKIIIISLVAMLFVMLLFLGAGYYVSSKISPEKIQKITRIKLEKIFPNAIINLGHMEFSFGTHVKFNVEKLQIYMKDTKKGRHDLLIVDDVFVKIPIWSLLIGSGTADIRINNPRISYSELRDSNNWQLAMGSGISKSLKDDHDGNNKDSSMVVAGILSRIKFNFRLINVALSYNLADGRKGRINLHNFLIKNLNFETATAFKINSGGSFEIRFGEVISFDASIIGQINLKELVKNKKFSSLVVLNFSNLKLSTSTASIPDIKVDFKVLIDENGRISGDFTTSFGGQSKIFAGYSVTSSIVKLSDISGELYVNELFNMFEYNNSIFNSGKAKLNLSGNIVFDSKGDKKFAHVVPDLEFSLSPRLAFKYETLEGTMGLTGYYKGKAVKIDASATALNGNLDIGVKGDFDINRKRIEISKLTPFKIDIRLSNMQLDCANVRPLIYTDSRFGFSFFDDQKNKDPIIIYPVADVNLEWSHLKTEGLDFSGKGRFFLKNNVLNSNNMDFRIGNGSGVFKYSVNFEKKGVKGKLKLNLKRIDVSGVRPFLPTVSDKIKGVFSGTIGGKISSTKLKKLKFDINAKLNGVDGELRGLNFNDKIDRLFKAVPFLKKKETGEKYRIGNGFEKFIILGRFKHHSYKIKRMHFVGTKKRIDIKGNGILYPVERGKSGKLYLYFKDNIGMVSDLLEKSRGNRILPILLRGKGFDLHSDYKYTTSKLFRKSDLKKKNR